MLPNGSVATRGSNRPAVVPHLLLDPAFRRGYAHLRTYGLSFEGWVYHTQIAELTDLAKAFPDTTIIFNHLGGPIGVGQYAGRRDQHQTVVGHWRYGQSTSRLRKGEDAEFDCAV